MRLIAIDPGSTHSAYVVIEPGDKIWDAGYEPNDDLRIRLFGIEADHLAIETLYCRAGNFLMDSHLQTQLWAGRFIERWGGPFTQVRRERVKGHFGAMGSNPDAIIRESLIGRFGGESVAIGGKRCPRCGGKGWRGRDHADCEPCGGQGVLSPPGPFHDWTGSDLWAALAIGCWWMDTQQKQSTRHWRARHERPADAGRCARQNSSLWRSERPS